MGPAPGAAADHGLVEDGLAAVGVAGPFVKDEDGPEILQVDDAWEEASGRKS